jgi:hypothetical protein
MNRIDDEQVGIAVGTLRRVGEGAMTAGMQFRKKQPRIQRMRRIGRED